MFPRLANTIFSRTRAQAVTDIPESALTCMLVRWRKRRWTPRAASKMFVVRKPVEFDPEEREELIERYQHYRTHLRAIRWYLRKELREKKQAEKEENKVETSLSSQELWKECLEINEQWNQESAVVRKARQDREWREHQEKILQEAIEIQREKEIAKEKARQNVLMESTMKYITLENLEEEIEKALDTKVDYNFAIDQQGNRYLGLDLEPQKQTVDKESEESNLVDSSQQAAV